MPIIIITAIIAFGFIVYDMRVRIIRTENVITHMDQEVDEANTGIKRLLKRDRGVVTQADSSNLLPVASADNKEFDFGIIEKKNGVVNTTFMIKNDGEGALKINAGDITTSCGCTTAKIDKENVAPNDEVILTVFFDPNFHEELQGRFSRSVFVPTNDPDNREIEFKIFVEIKS